jgi:hypothetical protein
MGFGAQCRGAINTFIQMKQLILFLLSATMLLSGCASGVVPMGRDTYMISGSSPGLIGTGSVRAKLLKQADKWCKERGLVMVPISYSGTDAVYGGQWASAEVIFRAVPPSDAENVRPTYERAPDHHEMVTIRNR